MTPNHQKQCECLGGARLMYEQDGVFIHEQCGGEIRKLEKLPPQVEKVSEEKLYSLRGGMPEEWKKLKIEDALPLVEKQIGGALRRLQVQEDQPYYKACEKCQEDGSGDFSCFFRHATDEEKRSVICSAAEEGWKEQEKMVQGAKLFARDFTETIEDLAKDDAPTPENDSWQPFIYPLHDLLMAFQKNEDNDDGSKVWETRKNELYELIETKLAAAYERGCTEWNNTLRQSWHDLGYDKGQREERTKLREVAEGMIKQPLLWSRTWIAGYETAKKEFLTALSEGEGR